MQIIINILATLVGLEFLYIMYLETFATTSAHTTSTFGMSAEDLKQKALQNALKNQGVYNGLIGILVLAATFGAGFFGAAMLPALLVFIVLVAIYGAATVSPSILLKQGELAIITLLLIIVQALI